MKPLPGSLASSMLRLSGGAAVYGVILATWLQAAGTPAPPQDPKHSAALIAGMVQTLRLNPDGPLFIPTHPRVTTTLRFPGPIGAPEGRGFTEDETKTPGEYLVAWTPGECHLTITPLPGAGPLNLNIPYEGQTIVAYFYPVDKQFAAVACVKLLSKKENSRILPGNHSGLRPDGTATLQSEAPPLPAVNAPEPAQLTGLVDKLRLLSTCKTPLSLAQMANTLKLKAAVSPSLLKGPAQEPLQAGHFEEARDLGDFLLYTRFIVRWEESNSLGFHFVLVNKKETPLAIDVSSFSVRTGDLLLHQVLSDAPAILMPGEECDAFVIVNCPKLQPLRIDNDWQASVDRVPTENSDKLFHVETTAPSP